MPNFDGTGPCGDGRIGRGLGPCGRNNISRGRCLPNYRGNRRNRLGGAILPTESTVNSSSFPLNRSAIESRIGELEQELKWFKDILEKEKESNGKE